MSQRYHRLYHLRELFNTLLLTVVLATAASGVSPAVGQVPPSSPPAATQPAASSEPTRPVMRVVDYNNPTLEDILDAWKEREEKVKSCMFVFDVTTTTYFHVVPSPKDMFRKIRNDPPVVTKHSGGTFAFQGSGMALGYPSMRSREDEKSSPINWYRSNGMDAGRYFAQNDGVAGRTVVQAGSQIPDLDHGPLIPFLSLYRPLYQIAESYTSVDKFSTLTPRITTSILTPDNDSSETVQVQFKRLSFRTVYTLKREAGFPVQVVTIFSDDGAVVDPHPLVVSVSIKMDEKAGWIPERWEYTKYDSSNGLPEYSHECIVKSASINEPVDESIFDPLNVPVGTRIEDRRTTGQDKVYVVGRNGRMEPTLNMNSEVPARDTAWDFGNVMICVNAAIFAALMVVWLIRRTIR